MEENLQRNEKAREELARAVAEATQVQLNDGKAKSRARVADEIAADLTKTRVMMKKKMLPPKRERS